MGKVLCATRGGEASYRTQDAAIALAKERGDELAFLFVVSVSFLKRSRRAVRPEVVVAEITRMGEFLLQMARERAEAQGMDAGVLLRCGHLQEALKAAALEHRADLLVLGTPAGDEGVYALRELKNLAANIETETGIHVIIL
jgi:nucleotide-binding universal stress UspA family protein